MFYRIITYIIFLAAIIQSCRINEGSSSLTDGNNVTKTPGKNIDPDSVSNPVIRKAGTPISLSSVNTITTPVRKHRFPAGPPRIMVNGKDYKVTDIDSLSARSVNTKAAPIISEARTGQFVRAKDMVSRDRNPYSFGIMGKLQGLNHNIINCLYQDRNRVFWFGSDGGGVSSFDGYMFTYLTEKSGLVNNYVYSVAEDSSGNIWIATRGGLSYYDGRTFTNYTAKSGLANERIQSMAIDSKGGIWLGTYGNGAIYFDGINFTNIPFGNSVASNRIHSVIIDKKERIWFGTEGGGLFIKEGEEIKNITITNQKSANTVRHIFEDKTGRIWVATDGGGIILYEDGVFKSITTDQGLTSNGVNYVTGGADNEIWIAYDAGGISVYNGEYFNRLTEDDGLINNSVISILFDRSENLWLSAYGGGIARYQGHIFTHFNSYEGLANSNVYGVATDSHGNLWLGPFGGGLIKYSNNNFIYYPPVKGFTDNTVLSIMEDSKGTIWAGMSGGGVYSFDGSKIKLYTEKEGLPNNYVFCMTEASDGTIWFGTYGGGISGFDGEKFTNISSTEGLSSNIVLSIIIDSRNDMWVGTSGGGVTRISNGKFTHYSTADGLGNNNIYSIAEDIKGNIWFGTNDGGATVYNGKSFSTFTENEGLSNNVILAILSDKKGNMWFGTRNGMNMLTSDAIQNLDDIISGRGDYGKMAQEKVLFRTYTHEDGFLGIGCSRGSIAEGIDGTIWIGANDMLTAYHPEGERSKKIPPGIALNGVELFDEVIPWKELLNNQDTTLQLESGMQIKNFSMTGITKWYSIPTGLSLSHNNNYLTFTFTGIGDNLNRKLRYQFFLEGLDQNWGNVVNKTYASYSNLPPGDYTFRVKALNRFGLWSNETAFSFVIRPPFHKTLFFKISFAVVLVLTVVILFRWRISSLRSQKAELEKEVAIKTSEVVRQNEELQSQHEELEAALNSLKEAQKQLILSEKMASLGILAAGVAHEINNPLNFILGGANGLEKYLAEHEPGNVQDAEKLIEIIKTGVKRAAEIVTSLNHFSRQDDAPRLECDIHVIIENCLLILQNELKNRININRKYSTDIYLIMCNEGKLHQAILNILTNASQAIEKSGEIIIETRINEGFIEISITDDGHGIPQESMPRIMDPFFTTKEPGRGTGLGLSITYNIIREHNGMLSFESETGKGTTATIKLPLGIQKP